MTSEIDGKLSCSLMQQRTAQPFPRLTFPHHSKCAQNRTIDKRLSTILTWKFKSFRFCLVLVWCADKSALIPAGDTPRHLRRPRISLHADMGANLSHSLCLFLMIELHNFQKWPLKSQCVLQWANSQGNCRRVSGGKTSKKMAFSRGGSDSCRP